MFALCYSERTQAAERASIYPTGFLSKLDRCNIGLSSLEFKLAYFQGPKTNNTNIHMFLSCGYNVALSPDLAGD